MRAPIRKLTKEQHEAFTNRTLTIQSTDVLLCGVPSHRRRLILMDVIVRTLVNTPRIERWSDDSVRFYIAGLGQRVQNVVQLNQELVGYVEMPSMSRNWINVWSPICVHCLRPHTEHLGDKCLFEATVWLELLVPPKNPRNGP